MGEADPGAVMQSDRRAHRLGRRGGQPDGLGDLAGDRCAGKGEVDTEYGPIQADVVQHGRGEQQFVVDLHVGERAERGPERVGAVRVI